MSHPKKTQCPNCQAAYPMPETKLNDPNARAKCGRCQQVFLLNRNLVGATPQSQPTKIPQSPSTNTPQNGSITTPKPTPTEKAQTSSSSQPIAIDISNSSGKIFDDMDDDVQARTPTKIRFADDELETFLTQGTVEDTPKKADIDEEAWAKALLDDDTPISTNATSHATNSLAQPNHDLDLDSIIPAAPSQPKTIKEKTSLRKILSQKPTSQKLATKKSFGSQALWTIGCLFLLGGLILQYALFNLETLAKSTTYATHVHHLCTVIPCSAPHANLDMLSIHSHHNSKGKITNIIIHLQNTSQEPLLYPDLLVKLKNKDGTVIGDFIVSHHSYLTGSQTSLLSNQRKRIMVSTTTPKSLHSIDVIPMYY